MAPPQCAPPAQRTALRLFLCVSLIIATVHASSANLVPSVTVSAGGVYNATDATLSGLTVAFDRDGASTSDGVAQINIGGCRLVSAPLTLLLYPDHDTSTDIGFNFVANIVNMSVEDTSIIFTGWSPPYAVMSLSRIQATLTDTTPLIYLKDFVLAESNELYITDISAEWTGSGGGSVILIAELSFTVSQAFQVKSVHAKRAASLLTFNGKCDDNSVDTCFSSSDGIVSFDYNYCEDCVGPMINVMSDTGMTVRANGMLRFANNTITGGQPFFKSPRSAFLIVGPQFGNLIISGIYSDGLLFDVSGMGAIAVGASSSFTMRHINVQLIGNAAIGFPFIASSDASSTGYVFLGNITENTVRFDDHTGRGYEGLAVDYAMTVLVDDMGFVAYNPNALTMMGNEDTPSASWSYCLRSGTASPVTTPLCPGDNSVQRASCQCVSGYFAPYCSRDVDWYDFYDGYDSLSASLTTTTTTTTTAEVVHSTTITPEEPEVTYAPPKHESPKLPSYAFVLNIVGLVLCALPLVIVVVCLLRLQRRRNWEAEQREMYMQQRRILGEVDEDVEGEEMRDGMTTCLDHTDRASRRM